MANMSYIEALTNAIEQSFSCKAKHLESVFVKEVFQDQIAWQGKVEVFELIDNAKITIAFGWGFNEGEKAEFVTIPSIAQITDPQSAVKAYILSKINPQK